MKKLLVTSAIAALLATTSIAAAKNGLAIGQDEEALAMTKASNSGLGNGGEKVNKNGEVVDKANEVGTGNNPDIDPGNSGNQCQGGKNNEFNGDSC